MTDGQSTRLRDLGEARIVRELIEPRFPWPGGNTVGVGDDAAILPAPPPGHQLVVTTDPCPTPVVCLVERPDFYHYGRLTAVVNVSDLAAMGAQPLGLVVATVMPEDMLVTQYERFLDGLAEACGEFASPVLGGNIKDGRDFTANGTALGSAPARRLMRRVGARPGDRVVVIGQMGMFWAAVLARMTELRVPSTYGDALHAALHRPLARIREGLAIASTGLVSACMDSSDGVSACATELARVNRADVVIHADWLEPHAAVRHVAAALDVDVRKLMLSWGNWELVATMPAGSADAVRRALAALGTPSWEIGELVEGAGRVWIEERGRRAHLNNFASERFATTSMFTHGIEAYRDFLLATPLTRE